LQDIDLLAQSFALRAGDPARGTTAQLRAGRRAGLAEKEAVETLASAHRLLWRLHASARLLTEKPLNMSEIGRGGQEFLLRETGIATLDELEGALAGRAAVAEAVISAELPEN
ncbi:MAG: putative nucleotidyltransferase substrate binding domain-containing protein, partial [Paracoccus sp. (in: a-proteobacteria)]|nr:putative nucleotidyltransferase substrate binding domain-containing protein [Paracoccus sp. (in: a-proteobacteria)]